MSNFKDIERAIFIPIILFPLAIWKIVDIIIWIIKHVNISIVL